ncbi:hypothetical protein [Streptomyces sp. NPDC015130]|uniref:hypothetical protein n=1 Tax=Streptomyces sp. NPDC015130 TaxID=3364940 RepID=UPI0036F8C17C
MTVENLPGKLVVEVGERQAWPFLTFLDTESDPEREIRLYLDTGWRITEPGDTEAPRAETRDNPLPDLARVNNSYVVTATEHPDVSVDIVFDNDLTLRISGKGTRTTAGEPWWLSPWKQ